MKIQQLDLFDPPTILASSTRMGEVFLFNSQLHIRTKPVSWMLNSTLIQDKITKGFIFATNLETGKFTTIPGTTAIEKVSATLQWSK